MSAPLTYRGLPKDAFGKPAISAPDSTIRSHTCRSCGAYFEDRHPLTNWCPTCSKAARLESRNESAKRTRVRRNPERLAALARLKGSQ